MGIGVYDLSLAMFAGLMELHGEGGFKPTSELYMKPQTRQALIKRGLVADEDNGRTGAELELRTVLTAQGKAEAIYQVQLDVQREARNSETSGSLAAASAMFGALLAPAPQATAVPQTCRRLPAKRKASATGRRSARGWRR